MSTEPDLPGESIQAGTLAWFERSDTSKVVADTGVKLAAAVTAHKAEAAKRNGGRR